MIRIINTPSVSFASIAKLLGVDFDQDLEINGISQNAAEVEPGDIFVAIGGACLLYTSPSPRDYAASRMPSSA